MHYDNFRQHLKKTDTEFREKEALSRRQGMDSLLTSLIGMLDSRSVEGIARSLGASGEAVSQGLKSSIAAVLGSMACKSEDPRALRTMLDSAPPDTTLPEIARAASDPNSPLISSGKRLLSGLFGSSETTVTEAVGSASGLRAGTASTLLSMAAPMVLSSISNRVRAEGMSMTSLGNLLERESGAIRNALPLGLTDLFWPRTAAATTYPVATPAAPRKASRWPAALAIVALLLGLVWLLDHSRRTTTARFGSIATGAASRMAEFGNFIKQQLPNSVSLNIPARGVEARLLSFIQDNGKTVNETTWFDFDRLSFNPGSATLQRESNEQLNNIAAILAAYPNVRMKIAGYTDNVGSADRNLQLSRDRANAVVAELVRRGISPYRLAAAGYGEQYPIADNSTEDGRARNRRVSIQVTQK
jgi:outer membrane protein OmpA-like peptidoglycan-associated protein